MEPDIFQLLGARWDRLWYVSPRRTAQEVGAVLASARAARGGVALPEGARVLDIGCGTGRHAVRLARLGFRALGIDRAPAMVAAAALKARAAGVSGRVGVARGDARRLPVRARCFDLAILLCQGAFGYPETPAEDLLLLREARRALRPGGALVLVALNRPWLDRQGEWRYDPARGMNVGREWHTLEDGRRRKVEMSARAYRPEEAASLLARAGFRIAQQAGARPGAYGALPLDDSAMQYMITAVKDHGGAARARAVRFAVKAKRTKRTSGASRARAGKVTHAPRPR